jgi:hypothetical protein
MNKIKQLLIIMMASPMVFLTSCDETEVPDDISTGTKKIDPEILDPNRSFNTTFDGKLFSVPSPIQTALLIKSANLDFNEKLLNSEDKVSTYNEIVSKSLNLGIYGADLGYVTLYDQNAKALNYLNAVEALSNDLGMGGAFDADFLTRFEKNSNNEDSMLVILTEAFRKGDSFLKENERKNISALILTGGWIESMYFAANLYKASNNIAILNRIGEQQQSLVTIIDILNEYNENTENDEILAQLNELNEVFSKIKMDYNYVEPETDQNRRITTIKSGMNIEFEDGLFEIILEKVNEIRGSIVA